MILKKTILYITTVNKLKFMANFSYKSSLFKMITDSFETNIPCKKYYVAIYTIVYQTNAGYNAT